MPLPIAQMKPSSCVYRMTGAALKCMTLYTHFMNEEPSASPVSSLAKPPLLEALGKPLLAYILAASEDEIHEWLAGGSDEFGSSRRSQPAKRPSLSSRVSSVICLHVSPVMFTRFTCCLKRLASSQPVQYHSITI